MSEVLVKRFHIRVEPNGPSDCKVTITDRETNEVWTRLWSRLYACGMTALWTATSENLVEIDDTAMHGQGFGDEGTEDCVKP